MDIKHIYDDMWRNVAIKAKDESSQGSGQLSTLELFFLTVVTGDSASK